MKILNENYQSTREVLNFNTDWLFYKGDINKAVGSHHHNEKWENVILPHTFQLEPKEWSDTPSYQGTCYYRRHFVLDSAYQGKKIFIRFQGVMINATVWINGQHLLIHHGGYLPFTVDITEYAVFDGSNVLTVKVDSNDDWETPPGKPQSELDFVYFGGIYRSVDLIATDYVHITDAIFANKVADGGVFVTYPEVSQEKAVVRIQTNVKNENEKQKSVSLKTTIVEENSHVETIETKPQDLIPESDHTFKQDMIINRPKLWNMSNPNLYSLMIKVLVDDKEVDSYQMKIGIRTIKFTSDQGFFINGAKVMLNGVNFHEDYLYVGSAVSDSMLYRDVKKIKEAGFNLIRTGHYPHNEAFMNACNELGIATIVPTPGWQYYTDKGNFAQRSLQMTRDMIRLYRNYPSVILWEPILNETWYPETFSQEAYKVVHEEYPTNQAYASSDFGAPYGDKFDVVYKEAYSETKPLITREWGDANHNIYDGERSARKYGEESLVRSSVHRQNSLKGNSWHDENEEDGYWDWSGLNANPRISGYALWSYNDYNRGMSKGIAHSGIVDRDRYLKFNYYWFQSQCSPYENNGPMIFIANYWTHSSPRDIHIYTNTEEVELYINDKYLDTRKPNKVKHISHPIVVFPNIPWETAQLKVKGLINGSVVATDEVTTPEEPSQLMVEFDTNGIDYLQANGSDMIMAHVSVRDQYGHLVPTAHKMISLHLSGPGILIGNGDQRVKANPVTTEAGIAPAFIRSTLNQGNITLTATAPGLKSGKAIIKSVLYTGQFVQSDHYAETHLFDRNNLMVPKSITVSSERIGNKGIRINDENPDTDWLPCESDVNPWILVDLGENYNMIGSQLIWLSEKHPKKYKIQISSSRQSWITIVDKLNNNIKDKTQYDHFASNARYLRIQLLNQHIQDEGIVAFRIFGTKQTSIKSIREKKKVNIASNKKTKTSSFSLGNEPFQAINSNMNTMWQAKTYDLPQWFLIDLEEKEFVTGAKIIWGKDSTHYTYKIQVSTNGCNWDNAVEKTTSGSYYHPIDFTTTYYTRYVRIWIDNVLAGGGTEKVAIKLVELYGN